VHDVSQLCSRARASLELRDSSGGCDSGGRGSGMRSGGEIGAARQRSSGSKNEFIIDVVLDGN
jgi:hypothetical protein